MTLIKQCGCFGQSLFFAIKFTGKLVVFLPFFFNGMFKLLTAVFI